jgi:HK97 gp10 family phage protein
VTIDGREVERLAFDLTEQTMAATKRASVVVRKTSMDIVGTAQQLVPVDTSATKQSIGADIDVDTLGATIGPTTHYAHWLEFGTSRMAPHAFMGPALDRHTPAFVQAMAQIGDLRL